MKIFNVVVDDHDYLIDADNEQKAIAKIKKQNSGNAIARPATPKQRFDFALKQLLIKGESFLPSQTLSDNEKKNGFGFEIKRYKKTYDRYLSKEIKMPLENKIFGAYRNGKGNELSTGKFYSIASSSRFVVSSFSECDKSGKIKPITKIGNKKIECLDFEHPCPIDENFPIPPQLDASFKIGESQYFIEAKCHEIFDSHPLEIRMSYIEFLNSLIPPENINGGRIRPNDIIPVEVRKNNKTVECMGNSATKTLVTFSDFGVKQNITHFDFAQFIKHLMGIISDQAENKKFYYLFYKYDSKTKDKNFDFGKRYCELEEELHAVAEAFAPVFKANKIEFGYLYNDKFDTLTKKQWDNKIVLCPRK